MKSCPGMCDRNTPDGVEVYQLTPGLASSNPVYPDSPGFLEDGRGLLLHTSDGPQLCRPEEGGALERLRDRVSDLRGVQLAPDGRHLIFSRGEPQPGIVDLHRMDLATGISEPWLHLEGLLEGTRLPVDRMVIEAVSWDGSRLAGLAYLDYERKADGETGVVRLDARSQQAEVVFKQPLPHAHLRYFPAAEAPATHRLMFQHHHERHMDIHGKEIRGVWDAGDRGADLHIVNDDGTGWHDLPFGRDGEEACIGHQIWRGSRGDVASVMLQNQDNSYGWSDGTRQHVVAGSPVPGDPRAPHCGRIGRDAYRRELSHPGNSPRLCHLAADHSGLRFVFDTFPVWSGERAGMAIYLGEARDAASPLTFHYLLNSGALLKNGKHAHPILSPDGSALFFTSNFYGTQQAYMAVNLPWDVAPRNPEA